MIALRCNLIDRCWRWRRVSCGWLLSLVFILSSEFRLQGAEPAHAVTVYRLLEEWGFPLAPGSEYPFRTLSPDVFIAAEQFAAAPIGENRLLTTYDSLGLPVKYLYYIVVDSKVLPATLESADPWMNLAVLRLNEPLSNKFTIGGTKSLSTGESLVVPLLEPKTGQGSRKSVKISAILVRTPPNKSGPATSSASVHDFGGLVALEGDVLLRPGMPLLNSAGEIAAITTGVVSDRRWLAIPIDSQTMPAIESLIQRRTPLEYGFLGLEPGSVKDLPGGQSLSGVYVRQVMQHAPATKAGIREENPRTGEVDVVAEVNGEAIESPDQFLLAIGRLPFESTVKLSIRRGKIGGETQTIPLEVKLAKRFAPPERPFFPSRLRPPWRGISIDYFTAIDEYGARARLVAPEGCVAIVSVATDSSAWKAGLRPGQFLTQVGDVRVKDEGEFIKATVNATGSVKVTTSARSDGIRLEPQTYELAP